MSHIRNFMSSNLSNISVEDLKRAVALRERIEDLQQELAGLLGESPKTDGRIGRRTLSPAARERIAAAQRRRWAEHRKGTGAAPVAHKRRKMSAAARARISAIAKARWAKAKAKGLRTLAN
jgi:hypothetical protein